MGSKVNDMRSNTRMQQSPAWSASTLGPRIPEDARLKFHENQRCPLQNMEIFFSVVEVNAILTDWRVDIYPPHQAVKSELIHFSPDDAGLIMNICSFGKDGVAQSQVTQGLPHEKRESNLAIALPDFNRLDAGCHHSHECFAFSEAHGNFGFT